MAMLETVGGAFPQMGTSSIGNFPYSDKNEVIVGTFHFDGEKNTTMKKNKDKDYQSGSFGVDAKTMIGGSNYSGNEDNGAFIGSLKADPLTMIGATDAFIGSVSNGGAYDHYDAGGLSSIAVAVKEANQTLDSYQQSYKVAEQRYAAKLLEYQKRKHTQDNEYGQWRSCGRIAYSCKTKHYNKYKSAKGDAEALMNQAQSLKRTRDSWVAKVGKAQAVLTQTNKDFAAYKIALEKEVTARKKSDAEQAIERMRADAEEGRQELEGAKIDVASDPMVLAAKLQASKTSSYTTLGLSLVAVIVVIVIARMFK